MPYTSRAVAQRLLSKILERSGQIEEISTVSEISVQGALESELEARFLKRLENLDVEETRLRRPAVQGGTYDLQLGERRFEIEPQVTVGPSGGVPRPSRIDFVIRPEEEGHVPIAVFLDGFQYHRERIGKDLAQRRALRASRKCHVWSLTWKDVEGEPTRERGTGFLKSPTETFVKVLQSLGASQAGSGREAVRKGSFEWLISFLKNPGLLKKVACAQALLFAQGQRAPRGQGTSGGYGWKEGADAKLPEPLAGVIAQKGDQEEMISGLSEMTGGSVHLWAAAPKNGDGIPEGVTLALHLSEEDGPPEETWNEFLRLYNLLQLIPETYPAFGKGEGDYTDLIGQWEPPEQESFGEALEENPSEGKSSGKTSQNGRAWEPVLKHALPETEELLKGLKEKGAPPPEVPQYALQREGQIVAQAELAWPEQKVAVHLPARAGETGDFVEEGWSVYPLGEAKESATELARTLRE
jgi:DEAD/DEAH box helicase domain-containing protein